MVCAAGCCYRRVFGRLHQWTDGQRNYQQAIRWCHSPPYRRKCRRARHGGDGICQEQIDAQSGRCCRFQHREFSSTVLRLWNVITSSASKSPSSSFRTLLESALLTQFVDEAMYAYVSHQHRFIITLGWILNKPLTLLFDPLQSIVLFLSGMSPTLPFRPSRDL